MSEGGGDVDLMKEVSDLTAECAKLRLELEKERLVVRLTVEDERPLLCGCMASGSGNCITKKLEGCLMHEEVKTKLERVDRETGWESDTTGHEPG